MATSLSARLEFPVGLEAAFTLLTDHAYVTEVATVTGGREIEVTVSPTDDGGITVVSRRSLPAAVPSYAKALVGERIELTETRAFGPASPDGSRHGIIEVVFHGAPANVHGTMRLVTHLAGSVLDVDMQVKASVPFVGGKIERLMADKTEASMRRENRVISERVG